MALSKGPAVQLYARQSPTCDIRTGDWLLTRVTSKLNPHKLREFARLLGIKEDGTYDEIVKQAEENCQELTITLLRHWTSKNPYFEQLQKVFRKAEKLGLADRNTLINAIIEEEEWHNMHETQYVVNEEFKEKINKALRMRYKHPTWRSLSLYPWMNEMASRLSEVYTTLEIEYTTSRRTLKDYPELFQDYGSRILVLGKPGIGKTTFTHKIGLDWGKNVFKIFQSVFVVKLRDLHPDQTICNAIALQHYQFSPEAIHEYLVESEEENSVLLILDGLDEIDLKKYPQVKRILHGQEYPSCCVMTTSRPHVALEIKDYMDCIANITGFSKESAHEYISHIIPDPDVRREFFKLLQARQMLDMYKIPIILQALALLFASKQELPKTYTITYEQLVGLIYLKKVRDGNTRLSEEDIEAAMKETNKLAFDCLMKDQLVFPTDSITNPDVLLLGLLSVTKTATPYGKESLAQFAHKTLQEYAAGGHVATEYVKGRPAAWEKVKSAFTELFTPTEKSTRKRKRKTNQNGQFADVAEQHINTISATVKFIEAIMRNPEASIRKMAKIMLDKGFYDDDPDLPTLRKALENLEETREFTEEEFNAFFDYGMHFVSSADDEQKKKLKQRANNLLNNNFDAQKLATILSMMTTCMQNDQDGAIEVLATTVQSFLSSTTMVSPQEATKSAKWLQDQANSMKILLRFILGKLRAHRTPAEQILKEVAALLLDHAYDRSSGEVISFHFIRQYLLDLMSEAGFSHEFPIDALYVSDMMGPCNVVPSPLVVHINSSTSLPSLPDLTLAKALKLENVIKNLEPVIDQIQKMSNLRVVELQNTAIDRSQSDDSTKLAEALSSAGFGSLMLDTVGDISLCHHLVRNLPSSTKRLTMLNCAFSGEYRFPDTVNLECLHLAGQVSSMSKIFKSRFPKLQRLTITNPSQRKWNDVRSLLLAVREHRMPALQHICIRFANLSNRGKDILEIAKKCKLQTVDLMDTNLSFTDGQAMLDLLNLPSIQSVNLLHNRGLNLRVPTLLERGNQQQINILCAETKSTSSSSWWSLVFHLGYNGLSKAMCTIL